MHLDTATLSFVLATICVVFTSFGVNMLLEQEARINRLEAAIKSTCGANSPTHHLKACAEMSLPLKDQVSLLSIFQIP